MKWNFRLATFFLLLTLTITAIAGEPAYRLPSNGSSTYTPDSTTIKKPIPSTINKVGNGLTPANDAIYDNVKNTGPSNTINKLSKTQKIVRVGVGLKTANHIRKNK